MERRIYYAYIMTNRWHTTLYVGMTNNIYERTKAHKKGEGGYFTSKYKLIKLIYYEEFCSPSDAITREKQIKGWTRKKKEELINRLNPKWKDMGEGWDDDG